MKMSAQAFNGAGALRRSTVLEESAAKPTLPEDSELMQRVLRETETLAATEAGEPLTAGERAALWEVARRHRGAAWALEPVAVDLVETFLRARYAALSATREFWRTTAHRIASTLLADPAAAPRLQAFWSRLSETVP